MCGRYTLMTEQYDFGEWFGIEPPPWLVSRYNIAPSYNGAGAPPIIRVTADGHRELVVARWWFIPSWWDRPPKELPTSFNARAEEIEHKRFFKEAFRHRRCLVPASGWYEYRGKAKNKESYYFHLPDHEPLALGGLWEQWVSPQGEVIDSFAILTTAPNDVARPIHQRMPLVIPRDSYDTWLDTTQASAHGASRLLQPWSGPLVVYQTRGYGNDPSRDGVECIKPTLTLDLFGNPMGNDAHGRRK